MRSPRRLSVMGALLLSAGTPAIVFAAPAHAAPRVEASPAPGPAVPAVAEAGLAAAPGKVTGLTAGSGDGTLMLSFAVPGDGGSGITGYDYSTDGGTTWKPLTGLNGTTTKQATISKESGGDGTVPLGYNVQYSLEVRAVNGEGPGAASDAYSATIPPKAPGAPGPITTGVQNGAITLSFPVPRDYGSPVTGWEYSSNNGMDWKPLAVTGNGPLAAIIANQSTGAGSTALQAGQQYQLRIRAKSDAGQGQETQTFSAGIPATGAPAAPGSVTAAPSGNNVGVDFAAPGQGDSAITGYQYSTDDGSTWKDTATTGSGSLHAELATESGGNGFSLARGRAYRIRVRAVNTQGPGLPSAAAEVALPAAAPGAAFDLSAVPGTGSLTLSFKMPSDNGSPITGWQYTTDDGGQWQPLTGITGDWQKTVTITERSTGDGTAVLASGVTYQVRVRAVNAIGTGPDSQTFSVGLPVAGSPGAPSAVAGSPAATGGMIKLDFTVPGEGNSAITKYQYSTDDGSTWADATTTGANASMHTDLSNESGTGFNLYPGHPYRIRLRAVNTQGPGLPSAAEEVTLPAAAPGRIYKLSAVPRTQGGFAISFDGVPDNGSPITGFEYTTDNGAHWKPLTGVTGTMQRTAVVVNQSIGDGTTPLAGGGTYQIRLRAINAIGTGEDGDTVKVSLPNAGSPAAPGSVTAAPAGNTGIGVDFAVPGQGDSAITGYQYSTDGGNTWRDTATTGNGPLHAALTIDSGNQYPFGPGGMYSVRIRAVNTQGPGLPSAAAEVNLPPSAPGEPFDLRTLPGNGSLTLSFKAPMDNGRKITAWEYTTDNGAHWRPLTGVAGDWQLSATIGRQSTGDGTTALVAGASYQIRVHAVNEIGVGADSKTVTGGLPDAGSPAAPSAVIAAVAKDKITVTFGAPDQGASPVLKYQYSTDDGGSWSDIAITGTGPLTADITMDSGDGYPLHPGQQYGVRMRAVNTQGPGLPSSAAGVNLPPTAPAAPSDVRSEPGDRSIGLNWGAMDNGDKITGYAYSTNNGTDWRPLSQFAFSMTDWTTSTTITTASTGDGNALLQNGQTYQVRLRATNSIGTGPDSEPVVVQLPLPGSPARPTKLAVSPIGDTIGVDFTAPDQGTSTISKYQYSTDGGGTWRDLTTTGAGSLHAVISGESDSDFTIGHDERYLVRVRAVNAQGAGLPSAAAEIRLPASAPGAPIGVTPVPGNRQVTVTFGVRSNGGDLTGFEYSTDNGVTWRARTLDDVTQIDEKSGRTTITTPSSGDSTTRLANGVTYQLRLRASNELGTGPASDAVSFIPAADLPGTPIQITATPGDRRITVTYQVSDDGGSPVTGLRYSTDGGSTWADATPTGTGTLTAVILGQSAGGGTTPLVNGTAVSLSLRLLTAAGAGKASAATQVTPFSAPDAPGGLTAKSAKDGVALQFTAPGTGGSPITGYDYSTDGGATWAAVFPNGTANLTTTITITTASATGRPALAVGTGYQLAVRARNAAGAGAGSATATLTFTAVAGAPGSLVAAPRNQAAALTFQAPTDTGGTAITGYQVTNDGVSWSTLTVDGTDALKATVADLANNTAYQIRVRAVTAAGPGAEAGPVTVTPLAAPAAPSGTVATAKTATITVTWVASPAGGAAVTGYTAIASPGPATCDTTGATTCVLGAQADQPYTITVVAHSASGDSSASGPSDSVTAASPVIPPTPPVIDEPLVAPAGDDGTKAPGETITLKGSGYAPNSTVELIVYSSPVSLGTVVTDDKGEFSVNVVVPRSLPVGDHSIAAVGADPDGNVRAMGIAVTVAPAAVPTTPTTPTTQPPLAVTGDATADQARLGLLMLLLGAGLVGASRTRRWHPRHRQTSPRR